MGDDAILWETAPKKKSGCLKWTCGCLACFLVVGVVGGIFVWRWLGSWDSGKSAWEHIPPETIWAVDVHDTRALFNAALADPGMETLLRNALLDAADYMGDDVEFPAAMRSRPGIDLAEIRRSMGPWFRILLPNVVTIGDVGGEDGSGIFFICMPPAVIRWAVGISSDTGQIEENNSSPVPLYYSSVGGWLVVAMRHDTVQVVLDGWHKKNKPLGPGLGLTEPYLFAAVRAERPNGDAAGTAEPGETAPNHFTLADPFAAAPAGSAEKPSEYGMLPEKPLARLAILPGEFGWSLWGDIQDENNVSDLSPVVAAVDKVLGTEQPSLSVAEMADFELSLRASPETAATWKQRLAQATFVDQDTGHPNRALLSGWLNKAWLANAGGDFSFLASASDAPAAAGAPPMPHLALGWTIRDDVPPARAGGEFSNALALWLDSLSAPGGPLLLQTLKSKLSYSVDRNGDTPAGVIELPAIVLNGARPAWRFNTGAKKPMGWIATDPGAIPSEKRQATLQLPGIPAPARDRLRLAGGWHFSRQFTTELFALLRDRLPLLAGADGEMEEYEANVYLGLAERTITAFPRGGVVIEYDNQDRSAVCKALVPSGERVSARK